MKSTTLPLPDTKEKKSAVPIFKIIFAKKSIFILTSFFLALISFFSARCSILTYCSPFALALACAMPNEFTPAAVLGAAAGYLTAGYEIVPVRYLAALILAVVIKRLFSQKISQTPIFAGICALICSASTGIAASVLLDEVEQTLIPYTAESFIAAAAAIFWAASAMHIKRMTSLESLRENELSCLLISVFLIILSLSYIKIYGFSLSKILACFTILISSYYGKIGAGAIAGIGAATALSLGSEDTFTFAGLCVSGVLAGLGAAHSRPLSAIALEAGLAVPLLFGLGEQTDFIPFAEAGIAAVIFLLIPKKALKKLRFLNSETTSVTLQGIKSHAVSRLRYASDALGDVSSCVNDVKGKLQSVAPNKKTAVYLNTMNKTCEKCGLKYYCWEHEKDYTVSIFKKIEKMLEEDKELTVENLPNNFGAVCIRNKALIKNFTLEHTAYRTNKLACERASSMREVMTVQFDALSQLLYDLSEDIEQKEILDSKLTDSLLDLLEYCGAEYLSAGVVSSKNFRIRVNIRAPYMQDIFEKKEFLQDLESICSRTFGAPEIEKHENAVRISYYEHCVYECDLGVCQFSAHQSAFCGDAYETLTDFEGKTAAVLADGMGKGAAASVNSSLAAGILSKLISSGFSVGAAIKVVNAALIVKDSEESFSSLDLLLVDLFSGRADFYKAGATCSVILRKGKTGRIELSSMPVGILENADFAHTSLTLSAGDRILLLSDGATQGSSEWINDYISDTSFLTASQLAKAVAERASKNQYGVHEDDISVIAVFIDKKQ